MIATWSNPHVYRTLEVARWTLAIGTEGERAVSHKLTGDQAAAFASSLAQQPAP